MALKNFHHLLEETSQEIKDFVENTLNNLDEIHNHFIDIKEYILKSREERRQHLKLNEPCIEIGGNSKEFRGLLAYELKTTIPTNIRNIYLCHACHNEKCSNPKHLYWGTPKDNTFDQKENGTLENINDRIIKKYGIEIGANLIKERSKRAGLKSKKITLSQEIIDKYKVVILESNPSKRGWISRTQQKLNLSHTQISRFVKKYCSDLSIYKR